VCAMRAARGNEASLSRVRGALAPWHRHRLTNLAAASSQTYVPFPRKGERRPLTFLQRGRAHGWRVCPRSVCGVAHWSCRALEVHRVRRAAATRVHVCTFGPDPLALELYLYLPKFGAVALRRGKKSNAIEKIGAVPVYRTYLISVSVISRQSLKPYDV